MADGVDAASALDRLKSGWKGFTKSVSSALDGEEASSRAASQSEGSQSPQHESTQNNGSWRAFATKIGVSYDVVPQGEGSDASTAADVETGDGGPNWVSGLTKSFEKIGKQVAKGAEDAKQGIQKAAERANSSEWGVTDSFQNVQSGLSKGFSTVSLGASQAGNMITEKGSVLRQATIDIGELSQQKLSEAQQKAASAASKGASQAREKATAAAGVAKQGITSAASGVTGGLSGLGALAMSPKKLAQAAGLFFLGMLFISFSFSFLAAPKKFALMFALGSLTLMSSFAVLKGPQAFAAMLVQKDKLPFSGAYALGLIGCFVSIILGSTLLTAFFGFCQFIGLLYFLASTVPGGQTALNFTGRMLGRCMQAIAWRS